MPVGEGLLNSPQVLSESHNTTPSLPDLPKGPGESTSSSSKAGSLSVMLTPSRARGRSQALSSPIPLTTNPSPQESNQKNSNNPQIPSKIVRNETIDIPPHHQNITFGPMDSSEDDSDVDISTINTTNPNELSKHQKKKLFYAGKLVSTSDPANPQIHSIQPTGTSLAPIATDKRSEQLRGARLLKSTSLLSSQHFSSMKISASSSLDTQDSQNQAGDYFLANASSQDSTPRNMDDVALSPSPSVISSQNEREPSNTPPAPSTPRPTQPNPQSEAGFQTPLAIPVNFSGANSSLSRTQSDQPQPPVLDGFLASPRPIPFPPEYLKFSSRRVVDRLRLLASSLGTSLGGQPLGNMAVRILLQHESRIDRTLKNAEPLPSLMTKLSTNAKLTEAAFAKSSLDIVGDISPLLKFDHVLELCRDAQRNQQKDRLLHEEKEKAKELRRQLKGSNASSATSSSASSRNLSMADDI